MEEREQKKTKKVKYFEEIRLEVWKSVFKILVNRIVWDRGKRKIILTL